MNKAPIPDRKAGSLLLLEKAALFNQCAAYVKGNANDGDDREGVHSECNQLMGGPQIYPLLAVSRAAHKAAELVSLPTMSSEELDASLQRVIATFTAIHQRSSPSSSRKVWWLEDASQTGGEAYQKTSAAQLIMLSSGLPTVPQLLASADDQRLQRKRARPWSPSHSIVNDFCDHLVECHSYPEFPLILQAIRQPASSPHVLEVQRKGGVKAIGNAINAPHTDIPQQASDHAAVQAYLTRNSRLLAKLRDPDFLAMSESKRVAYDMKLTAQQRARFSRSREKK